MRKELSSPGRLTKANVTAIILSSLTLWNARALSASNNQNAKPTTTITAISDVWCPYSCEKSAQDRGVFVDIIHAALKGSPYQLKYKTSPWARSLKEGQIGRADIVISLPTSEVGTAFDIDFYGLKSPTCGFTNEGSKKSIKKGPDLETFSSIGIIKGYVYGPQFDAFLNRKDLPPGKVQSLLAEESVGANLKKVKAGYIEVTLEDPAVVSYWSKKLNISGLQNVGCSEDVVPIYIGVSKKAPHYQELKKSLKEGINSAEKSGEIGKILKKYDINPDAHI